MAAGAVAGGLGALLGIGGGVFRAVSQYGHRSTDQDRGGDQSDDRHCWPRASFVSTVGRNLINLRLGMLLEVASAAGVLPPV